MPHIVEHESEDIWGYAKRLRFVREVIRQAFAEDRALKVLDLGCGNGSQLAIPLAGDPRLEIVGMDPDAASIDHGRRLAASRQNVKFICGSLQELGRDECFDLVILSEVLEHLDAPEEMLAAATRVLAGDGVLIVTVPNGYGEFEIDSWMFRALRLQKLVDALATKKEVLGSTDNHCGHVQFFTRARLSKLFKAAGLVVIHEGAGSFLAGPIAGHFVAQSRRLIDLNARITDRLPFVFASGWYFALRRQTALSAEAGK